MKQKTSIIVNIKLYNIKNYFKPKLFVTEIGYHNYLVFQKKLGKIKNWKKRVNFVREMVKNKDWIKIPEDHTKVSEIKFIYMNYEESRLGKWGPFAETKFSNPKKISGTMKAIVQLKKMVSRRSFVWV